MCSFKELYLSAYVSVGADLIAVEQLHNGHVGAEESGSCTQEALSISRIWGHKQ